MQPLPVAPPALLPSVLPLPAPFTRCPVCRGTTTMATVPFYDRRCLFSLCITCDAMWDLSGNMVRQGTVIILPKVDPINLPSGKFEGCSSSRPHSNAGRPRGVKDRKPRNYANKRKEEI